MNDGTPPDALGGLILPGAPSGGDSSDPGNSRSAETIRTRKQRSDAGQPRGPRNAGQRVSGVSGPPLSPQQFAVLYAPETWGRALSAPADALAVVTGSKIWEFGDKEREALGNAGSVAAQSLAIADPRYLALSLALITVLDVYGVHLAVYLAEKRAEKKTKENKPPS